MKTEPKLGLGEILILEKILEPEELEELLQIQAREQKPLGQICVERGLLSSFGLKHILKKHHRRMRLGEVLLTMGLVEPPQLERALEFKKGSRMRLGECLVSLGILSEEDIVLALSEQLDIPRVIPDLALIDVGLLEGVSHRFLSAHEALPAFKNPNGAITVIMSDPLSEETLRDLQSFFKCPILPALATKTEITETLQIIREQATVKDLNFSQSDLEFIAQKDLTIEEAGLSDNENRTVTVVNFLISRAIRDGASDIHIEPQTSRLRVRYRVDGVMYTKTDLPKDLGPPIVSRIKALCGLDITEKRRYQDGRIEAKVNEKDYDLRIATYPSLYGENMVIRLLHRQTLLVTLEQLGFSPAALSRYWTLLNAPTGVILVTGPTGSGKTTTLYASLTYLTNKGLSIVTVEDPIEYAIEGVVQGNYDPKIGVPHMDYIKAMMRQDPDIVMIGEIRDSETAKSAIQISLTGHKVFSTFHTEDTVGALIRLLDMGVEPYLVASTISVVMSQRLVRLICRYCREKDRPGPELLKEFFLTPEETALQPFFLGHGCPKCHQTGFKGRTAVHELLLVNDDIREAILQRRTAAEIRHIARSRGHVISLREDGVYKAIKGMTTLSEINRVIAQRDEDTQHRRSLREIIDLCTRGQTTAPVPDVSAGCHTEEKTLPEPLYQITINCHDLKQEQKKLAQLYDKYTRLSREPHHLDSPEFTRIVAESLQKHGNGRADGLILVSIRYKGGCERIYIEQHEGDPIEITPLVSSCIPTRDVE